MKSVDLKLGQLTSNHTSPKYHKTCGKMLRISCFILLFGLGICVFCKVSTLNNNKTDRPIIGLLVQEISDKQNQQWPGYTSFINALHVKFVEGGGGSVVPIW